MPRKYLIVLFFLAFVGAARHAVPLQGLAFADSYTQDGKPCPPECVSDSMEIVTWYPSPYNEYEELRLYPKRSADESQCNSFEQLGLMYYNQDEYTLKICRQDPDTLNYSWEKIPVGQEGYWEINGSHIFNTNLENVGIGTNSPTYKLDVRGGQVNVSGGLCLNGDCKTSWPTASGINGTGLPIASAGNLKGYTTASINGATYVVPYYEYLTTLFGGSHNTRECTSQNGTVVIDGSGNTFCKFSGGSCPSGWTPFQNWSTTVSSRTCQGEQYNSCGDGCCCSGCWETGSHSWENKATETVGHCYNYTVCNRSGGCYWRCSGTTLSASVTEIGCY